jgi:hypothetical protein
LSSRWSRQSLVRSRAGASWSTPRGSPCWQRGKRKSAVGCAFPERSSPPGAALGTQDSPAPSPPRRGPPGGGAAAFLAVYGADAVPPRRPGRLRLAYGPLGGLGLLQSEPLGGLELGRLLWGRVRNEVVDGVGAYWSPAVVQPT